MKERLYDLIVKIWETNEMPQDWKDANIIPIFEKGSKKNCGNYRGISLLSIAGKIMARVILNRINEQISPNTLPETQSGFRSGRSTIDMIFSLRQIQEKCIEQNKELYAVFIDFTKAFDTVSREGLWKILIKFGFTEKVVAIIKATTRQLVQEMLFADDSALIAHSAEDM